MDHLAEPNVGLTEQIKWPRQATARRSTEVVVLNHLT